MTDKTMPPNKNSLGSPPTAAVANAVARNNNNKKRGTRSNVAVDIPQRRGPGFEDENEFFRAAASPADVAAGEKPLMAIATGQTRSSQRATRQTARGKPRRSLPGQAKPETTANPAPVKASKAATRAMQAAREGRLSHISPSDLSTVSTAPPTPASVAAVNETTESPIVTQQDSFVDEDELTTTVTQHGNAAIQGSPEPLGMDEEPEDDDDELVPPPPPPPPPQVTAESQEEGQQFDEADGDFPMFDDDDDDDDNKEGEGFQLSDQNEQDDVGLPSEIDAEEKKSDDLNDIPSEDEQPKSALKTPKSALKTPRSDNRASDDDGDDDGEGLEEDKEGDGFNMVHDPETPESVREDRIRKEEQALEQKRKKKARKEPTTQDFSDEETPAKSTTSRRKKKHRVAFKASPEGYPVGPREYSTVPISDLKGSPDNSDLRRSRRVHQKPLAFWKNERPLYAPHNEDGLIGEAMGNMPVVSSYQTALPTPRKKKKVPEKTSKGKGKRGRPARVALDETPFDARKLKRKYDYLDGEECMVWDDGAKEVKEQSEYYCRVVCLTLWLFIFSIH